MLQNAQQQKLGQKFHPGEISAIGLIAHHYLTM
jgi:hypothetical protein